MKNNLFEFAIDLNETNQFFHGEGRYHVPSSDYEGHVHGANMGGHARTHADLNSSNCKRFEAEFLFFLRELSPSKEDLSHALANISSYLSQKSAGGFAQSKLFETKTSPGALILRDFIKRINQMPFATEVANQINRHAEFARKKGNDTLIGILDDIKNT